MKKSYGTEFEIRQEIEKRTTKEILQKLKLWLNRPTEDIRIINTEMLMLEKIEKDLEVLEILKKNCFMKVWSSEEHNLEAGHYYLVIQESKEEDLEYMSIPITKNDYQKIKEWLENDKQ